MKRDKFCCKLCGDKETTLNVHHKIYRNSLKPWEYDNSELITLCEHCHSEIGRERFKKIGIENIKIYKSTNWHGGSRIMFIAISGCCTMRIYNGDGSFLIGYNLREDIPDIIKILRKSSQMIKNVEEDLI